MLKALEFLVVLAVCICVGHARTPSKIVGGTKVDISEFPHQVSLRFNGRALCGGSIVDDRHILTAASCLVLEPGVIIASIKSLSGTNDVNDTTVDGTLFNISLAIIHENYDPDNFWIHDIAILRTASPMFPSMYTMPILLPRAKSNLISQLVSTVSVTGWGGSSRYLQKMQATVLSHADCQDIFSNFGIFHDTQGCASMPSVGSRVAKGDGGGPLTLNDEIFGILSVYVPRTTVQLPVVFTEVRHYVGWIKDMLDKY